MLTKTQARACENDVYRFNMLATDDGWTSILYVKKNYEFGFSLAINEWDDGSVDLKLYRYKVKEEDVPFMEDAVIRIIDCLKNGKSTRLSFLLHEKYFNWTYGLTDRIKEKIA
jgi:hypothetical protein